MIPVDHKARAEDVAFLASQGVTLHDAATRLGLTLTGLEKWAQRYAPETLAQLRANKPPLGNGFRQGHVAVRLR